MPAPGKKHTERLWTQILRPFPRPAPAPAPATAAPNRRKADAGVASPTTAAPPGPRLLNSDGRGHPLEVRTPSASPIAQNGSAHGNGGGTYNSRRNQVAGLPPP